MVAKAAEIQAAISEGARAFLTTEYKYMGIFGVGACGCMPQSMLHVSTHH